MRICHLTPHLPPDQAANALLPVHLGQWARQAGDEPSYVSYPSTKGVALALPGPVSWVGPRRRPGTFGRLTKVPAIADSLQLAPVLNRAIKHADIIHIHSNGPLTEIGGLIAGLRRKPFVLTLYGTEIWHYEKQRFGPDLFTRAYKSAAQVTFYSHGLSERARELELRRRGTTVIYPPVGESFAFRDFDGQAEARQSLGIRNRHLLLNVKRLHPLAGQRTLLEALNEVIRTHPDTRLIICGTGPLLDSLRSTAQAMGVDGHVTFTGLVDNRVVSRYYEAADAFVLPSLLEACPTVAIEALACGTPVISSDNPGGVELGDLFGLDVQVVPKENPLALARAVVDLLDSKRRTRPATREIIEREFSPTVVASKYYDVYRRALKGG